MLSEKDYQDAANLIGCEAATIKAVQTVESSGKGFHDDGSLVIRFEAHKFHKYTDGTYDASYPQISHNYDPKLKTDTGYAAFNLALKLNRPAALLSTSYGLFQLMGFNFKLCGYSDAESFYQAMCQSERNQLLAFTSFVKSMGMDLALRQKDWKSFAYRYNGKSYIDFNYDKRLADAYAKFNRS